MRAFIIIAALISAVPASAHPCAVSAPLTGTFENGDAAGFRVEGRPETFVLAGLADPTGALAVAPGTPLTLHPASPHLDRYGRAPVHAFAGDVWLQAETLSVGRLADPLGLPPACATALLATEPKRAAIPAADTARLAERAGRFTLVRGRVLSVGDRERWLYLNFGTKWDEDFTVSVAKTGRGKYRGDLGALQALAGRTITIRGALELRGGPLMRLRDEARIAIDD